MGMAFLLKKTGVRERRETVELPMCSNFGPSDFLLAANSECQMG